LTDLENSLTGTLAVNLQYGDHTDQQHLNYVATLPCKMLVFGICNAVSWCV